MHVFLSIHALILDRLLRRLWFRLLFFFLLRWLALTDLCMIFLQRVKPFELPWLLSLLLLCEIASEHAHDPALFLRVVRPLLKESHELFAHRE